MIRFFVFSVVLFVIITSTVPIDTYAQIEPFELQLEQIRDPQECTRKVIQGKSAEIPFTVKVFYDTVSSGGRSHEVRQQGGSFPISQQTNQVLIFHSNFTDQYQVDLNLDYKTAKERQVYFEYISGGQVVANEQEKFNNPKYCTTLFINTVEPQKIPTREELFGDVYYTLQQIPAMTEGFNRNTITFGTTINVMWFGMMALGIVFFFVIFFILWMNRKTIHLGERLGEWFDDFFDDSENSPITRLEQISTDLAKLKKLDDIESMNNKIDELSGKVETIHVRLDENARTEQELEGVLEGKSKNELSSIYKQVKGKTDETSMKILDVIKKIRTSQKNKSKQPTEDSETDSKKTSDKKEHEDVTNQTSYIVQDAETDDSEGMESVVDKIDDTSTKEEPSMTEKPQKQESDDSDDSDDTDDSDDNDDIDDTDDTDGDDKEELEPNSVKRVETVVTHIPTGSDDKTPDELLNEYVKKYDLTRNQPANEDFTLEQLRDIYGRMHEIWSDNPNDVQRMMMIKVNEEINARLE